MRRSSLSGLCVALALVAPPAHGGEAPASPVIALLGADGRPRDTVWQHANGTVAFSVSVPNAQSPPRVAVSVRFRKQPWGDAEVSLDDARSSAPTYVYNAVIPADLKSDRNVWIVARTGLIARTSEMRIAVLDANGAPIAVTVREIGIVKLWEAAALALLSVAIALGLVRTVMKYRRRRVQPTEPNRSTA